MGKKRRRFDREFKIEAVREALKGERTQKEVARDLGINPETLYRWCTSFGTTPRSRFLGTAA